LKVPDIVFILNSPPKFYPRIFASL